VYPDTSFVSDVTPELLLTLPEAQCVDGVALIAFYAHAGEAEIAHTAQVHRVSLLRESVSLRADQHWPAVVAR
jgi:hypothetical protein